MSVETLALLCRELELSEADVTTIDGPLDLAALWSLYGLDRPDLKDEVWVPQTQAALAGGETPTDFFRLLQTSDVLVHHPYDSFTTSVEQFVEQAASDPAVLAIKQTIYRTAGPESAIVRSLIKAAEQGKEVVALVELTARFDEQANIERARVLEEAGVHVVYGLVGLKTHAKILLVVRQEAEGIRRYCHIGTGNYNGKTATTYEDLGLLTADPDLGADLTDLFNHLTGYSHQVFYRKLLVAPSHVRQAMVDRIEREAAKGPSGRITMKMNALVDAGMIEALYCGVAARRADRPHRPGHLLSPPRGPGVVGDHPGAIDRRAVPRALPDLPLRCRPGGGRVPHRFGRPHAPQPRPAGRGAHAGHRSPAPRPPGRAPRREPGRRHPGVGAERRRHAGTSNRRWPGGPRSAGSRSSRSLARIRPDARARDSSSHRDRSSGSPTSPPSRVCAPTHPTRSGSRPSTTTPTTSGSRVRARACATATSKAGR